MTTRAKIGCILTLTLWVGAFSAEAQTPRRSKKAWLISAAAVVAANFLDAHSSLGRPEANPLLRSSQGTFSARRGVVVKTAVCGGFLGLQALLVRRYPQKDLPRSFFYVNLGTSGVLTGGALHNYGTARAAAR